MPFVQKGTTERPLLTKPKGGFKMRLSKEQLKEFTDGIVEDELTTQEYEEQREAAEHEEILRLLGFKERRKIKYNRIFDPFDFEGKSQPTTEEDIEKEKLRGIAELFDTSEDCPVKTIEYGGTVEVITSYNRADGKGFKKIKNLPDNQYQNLETGKIYSKQKHEKRSETSCEFKNSVKELERLIELNFVGSNGYFITLAYDSYDTKADEVQKDFEKFYHRFHYYYGKRTNTKLVFIRVLEPRETPEEELEQEATTTFFTEIINGFLETYAVVEVTEGWHIHFLVKAKDGTDLKIAKKQIAKMWGNDNVYVCPISKSDVGSSKKVYENEKYSISIFHNIYGLMPFYNSGVKLFTCSQNVKRPVVHKMTRKEMKEKVAGYDCQYDYITRIEKFKKMHSYMINAIRHEKYKKKE